MGRELISGCAEVRRKSENPEFECSRARANGETKLGPPSCSAFALCNIRAWPHLVFTEYSRPEQLTFFIF